MNKRIIPLLLVACLTSCAKQGQIKDVIDRFVIKDRLPRVNNKTARAFVILGQSNAAGCSYISSLQSRYHEVYNEYDVGFDNVRINYFVDNNTNSSDGHFVKPSYGMGHAKELFGPEVGMNKVFGEHYKEEEVFILKYTWSGTILDEHWMDGNYNRGQLYKAAKNFITTSMNYLTRRGYDITLDSICWMQGESDAFFERPSRYYKNTSNMVSFFREDLAKYNKSTIKFIDAEIAEIDLWTFGKDINKAKLQFSNESEFNYLIKSNELGLRTDEEPENEPDIAHFDSLSMITLGEQFGQYCIK